MAALLVQQGNASSAFTKFPDLPLEIRCMIWARASPTRPRVIQIAYEAEKEKWRACVDGCGGLPRIIPVCREARLEALKPYTRLLETWIDLEEDTIFISDPIFNIRRPRSLFMESAYLNSIKRIALTEDVYFGMKLMYESFPLLVDSQGAIIRKMQGLSHFILVLMEDGAGFDTDSDEAEFEYFDEEGLVASELDPGEEFGEEEYDQAVAMQELEEIEGHDSLEGGDTGEDGEDESVPEDEDGAPEGDNDDEIAEQEQWLAAQEEDAMERLCKGYFRHVGDIHFENVTHSPDFWDSWIPYLEQVNSDFDEQQVKDPAWSRPTVAIAEVKYGLQYIGQRPDIVWHSADGPEDDGSSEDTADNSP
ncbi:hypothetical protein VTL71DRAFT_5105 [Oculimacula yallundae]|uniref:2EXR domain-containing protein n=1 Tax=Oculimacula yallundae TaxID=86028 RepID=A0ABR4C065_9HELO